MTDIIIFGAGQFADVLKVYIEQDTNDNVVGYTVDKSYCSRSEHNGKPLVPWEELEESFPPEDVKVLGPISYRGMNSFRMKRFLNGKKRGYNFYSFIHSSVSNYSSRIGENVIILEGNSIQPFAEIDDNCILWCHNHIGHHTIIKKHCFLTGKVAIGGNSLLEEGVFATGCNISDNVTVGGWSYLQPGTFVATDLAENSILMRTKDKLIKNAAKRFAKKLLG